MADHNGNQFELGRVVGHLQATMDRNTDVVERLYEVNIQQASALERMGEDIRDLPARISATMPASARSHMLPQIAELLRSTYPILVLLAVAIGKSHWPEALPVLRAMAEAALRVSGTSS